MHKLHVYIIQLAIYCGIYYMILIAAICIARHNVEICRFDVLPLNLIRLWLLLRHRIIDNCLYFFLGNVLDDFFGHRLAVSLRLIIAARNRMRVRAAVQKRSRHSRQKRQLEYLCRFSHFTASV